MQAWIIRVFGGAAKMSPVSSLILRASSGFDAFFDSCLEFEVAPVFFDVSCFGRFGDAVLAEDDGRAELSVFRFVLARVVLDAILS